MRMIILQHRFGLKLNIVGDKLVPILFADDTSILLLHSKTADFNNDINTVFKMLTD